jgi:hypothetical protein
MRLTAVQPQNTTHDRGSNQPCLHEQPCMRAQPLLLACRGRVFLHAFAARVLMNFHNKVPSCSSATSRIVNSQLRLQQQALEQSISTLHKVRQGSIPKMIIVATVAAPNPMPHTLHIGESPRQASHRCTHRTNQLELHPSTAATEAPPLTHLARQVKAAGTQQKP